MNDKIIAVRKASDRGKPAASSSSSTPELKPPAKIEVEKPVASPEAGTASAPSGSEATSPILDPPRRPDFQRPRKVERPEPKPLVDISEVSNASGEIFNPGDKISVIAPWGEKVTAEIQSLYHDEADCSWARYVPSQSRPDWNWDRGCIRAARLVKA